MVLISFKTAKTKKHIANFRFSYQIHFVVHYVDYLSEDITQRLIMFLASKSLHLPISSERNRPFLRKERETHISSERIRFGYLPCIYSQKVLLRIAINLSWLLLLPNSFHSHQRRQQKQQQVHVLLTLFIFNVHSVHIFNL